MRILLTGRNGQIGSALERALVVHFSTDHVFDGEKPAPYLESDAPAPINVYGESKLAGDCAIGATILLRSWRPSTKIYAMTKVALITGVTGQDGACLAGFPLKIRRCKARRQAAVPASA